MMQFVLQDVQTFTSARLHQVALQPLQTQNRYIDRIGLAVMVEPDIDILIINIATLRQFDQLRFKQKISAAATVRRQMLTQKQKEEQKEASKSKQNDRSLFVSILIASIIAVAAFLAFFRPQKLAIAQGQQIKTADIASGDYVPAILGLVVVIATVFWSYRKFMCQN